MATSSQRRRRAVNFSEYSQLFLVSKRNDTWFTSQERRRFCQEMVREVRRVTRALEDTDPKDVKQEQLYECIGIEMFLSEGFARAAAEAKRNHVAAVLSEQRRQRQQGVSDVEKLSRISTMSSQHTTERSQKLAEGYSKLENGE